LQKPQSGPSEDKVQLFCDLLELSRQQHKALQNPDNEEAIASYLHWSQQFMDKAKQIDEWEASPGQNQGAPDADLLLPLLQEIQNIQQQIEQELKTRFSHIVSQMKATRQAKTAVSGYYGQVPPVSIYFDEKH
jgi:hypothetical protein